MLKVLWRWSRVPKDTVLECISSVRLSPFSRPVADFIFFVPFSPCIFSTKPLYSESLSGSSELRAQHIPVSVATLKNNSGILRQKTTNSTIASTYFSNSNWWRSLNIRSQSQPARMRPACALRFPPEFWNRQSQKNPVNASAMLTGKFLRIRKVFATSLILAKEFPDSLENVSIL